LSGSKAQKRVGVTIGRRDLIAVPVPNARFLWQNQSVRVGVTDKTTNQKTENIHITIIVEGEFNGKLWSCGLEFDYRDSETFYCRPLKDKWEVPEDLIEMLQRFRAAFLPPMSGLAAPEIRLEPGTVDVRIGEGRTAEVLRNLCLNLYQKGDKNPWNAVKEKMKLLFGISLKEPTFDIGRGEISLYYQEKERTQKNDVLEISSTGRGTQQVLLLLTFLYLHPGAMILLDEPDAHLEILRQKQIFETIKNVAQEQGGQIIVATHSEVVLNESAQRDIVIAFIGKPHKLNDKSQLVKSLASIGWEQYFLAERNGWVLYLEGSTDLDMLRAFAKLLNHPAAPDLDNVFFRPIGDNSPKNAKKHFFALREAKHNLRGYALFDKISDAKIKSEHGLTEYSLKRKELENYFCTPQTLLRWASEHSGSFDTGLLKKIAEDEQKVMQQCITDVENSLKFLNKLKATDSITSPQLKASNDVLEPILRNFFERIGKPSQIQKSRFYELIPFMQPEEVDNEITEVLDVIHNTALSVNS
jgi:hypothetical protein